MEMYGHAYKIYQQNHKSAPTDGRINLSKWIIGSYARLSTTKVAIKRGALWLSLAVPVSVLIVVAVAIPVIV